MSFMSTAPRPQSRPSISSPRERVDRPVLGAAPGRRRGARAARARAATGPRPRAARRRWRGPARDSKSSGSRPTSVQQAHDVLGGRPLPRARSRRRSSSVSIRMQVAADAARPRPAPSGPLPGVPEAGCGDGHAVHAYRPSRTVAASAAAPQVRPRRTSSGSICGSRPRRSRNASIGSSEPPRESSARAERVAVLAAQPAVLLEPLDRVGVEHLGPDVGVVRRPSTRRRRRG